MKKFASLLLTVVLLATMLCVFAVPASAAGELYVQENMNISGEQTYSNIYVEGKIDFEVGIVVWIPCNLTIESGASVTCDSDFYVRNGCTVTIKSGASVTCDFFCVEDGSTVIIENGASVTCGELGVLSEREAKSTMTVYPGAVLTVNGFISVNDIMNLGGVLTGKSEIRGNNISLLTGGTVDLEITDDSDIQVKNFVTILQQYAPNAKYEETADGTYRVTAHKHLYNGICCGTEYAAGVGGEGSTLSEGNLAIITAVAGVAFGFLAAMVIFKKKKPALASGENTDEE